MARQTIVTDPYGGITSALVAARPGGVVRLRPGRYDESLVITKMVTVIADDPDDPPEIAPARAARSRSSPRPSSSPA